MESRPKSLAEPGEAIVLLLVVVVGVPSWVGSVFIILADPSLTYLPITVALFGLAVVLFTGLSSRVFRRQATGWWSWWMLGSQYRFLLRRRIVGEAVKLIQSSPNPWTAFVRSWSVLLIVAVAGALVAGALSWIVVHLGELRLLTVPGSSMSPV